MTNSSFPVVKFKRRARYLEFLVQVAQKALLEGLAAQAVEWCEETEQWLTKLVLKYICNMCWHIKFI